MAGDRAAAVGPARAGGEPGSGRPADQRPRVRQRRRQPGLVAAAAALRAAARHRRHRHRRHRRHRRRRPAAGGGSLRRAPLPLQLQLPRRRLPPRGAGRGGGPSRARRPRRHRSRRVLRRGPLRRGRPRGRPPHHLRRRAVARVDRPAERRRRPRGPAPRGAGARSGRLRPARPGPQRGPDGRAREGEARLPPVTTGRGPRRPLGRAHRLSQGHRSRRPHPRRSGPRRPGPGRPGRPVRGGQRVRRAVGPRRPARFGAQRRPGRAGGQGGGRDGRHQQRPLRGAGPAPAGHGHGRGAGPAQPRRDRRLASGRGHLPSPFRRRASQAVPALPRRRRAGGRARTGLRLRSQAGRPRAAALPVPRRPGRDGLPPAAGRAGRRRPVRRAWNGGRRSGLRPDRPRAGPDRAARVPRLLPDRVGHRRLLPADGHLLPGPGIGGQLGRLLRPRHHQRRCGVARPAVRAVPVPRA